MKLSSESSTVIVESCERQRKLSARIEPRTSLVKAHSLPELRPKQWSPRSTKELARQQAKRARRVERYEEIKALRAAGASISAIARKMGMQRETVRHFLRADEYP